MHRRRWVRRAAVSTVVGNMLMIIITLSLAAILVAWAGTSYGSFTSGSQLYFVQRQQALQERFVIEMVSFNKTGSHDTIMVFVRNVGLQQITIETIYINGTSLTSTMLSCQYGCAGTGGTTPPAAAGYSGYCTLPVTMAIGAVCEFFIGPPATTDYIPTGGAVACTGIVTGQWCSGTLFDFVVASARGNQATYMTRGP
jgi:archaellum component FlaF (FlaF/FlaG flagellin family)